MIFTADFKKGMYIEMDNVPYEILEFQHVKPGKGNAFIRTRIKNLINNSVLDKTFKSGDKVGVPDLQEKEMEFLYENPTGYHFMDMTDFEQISLTKEQVGDRALYLTENLKLDVLYYKGNPIALDLPNFVELKVVETQPTVKGATASGSGKPATLSTGLTLSVPVHIQVDDLLKVDTRTGEYVTKLK